MQQPRTSTDGLKLEQIIDPNPIIVTPTTLLSVAIAVMDNAKANYALVVDQRKVVGLFTAEELVKLVATKIDFSTTKIGSVVTQPVKTMERSQCQDIFSVWSFSRQHSLAYIPILNNYQEQELVGVVERDRLLELLESDEFNFCLEFYGTGNVNPCQRVEDELERFFNITPSLLCVAGFDGYFKRLNPSFSQILGFTNEELLAEPFINFVHPEDRAATIAEVEGVIQGKTTIAFENRYRTKDGNYRWFLWTASSYVEEQVIYAAARDISDRKQTEIQLQQERDFTAAVLDTVGALVTVLNRQGQIVSFNRTCEQISGYSWAEVAGRPIWDLLIVPEEKLTVRAIFERLLAGQLTYNYENHWLAKDGSRHLISWSNTALFDAQGKVEFVIATGIDVTQQRQVRDKLEHQFRQTQLLAEVTRKIRMFIGLDEILQTTVTEVQHLLTCDRVMIVELRANQTAVPISEAILRDYPPMLGYELADPLLVGKYLERYRQGKILAINDLQTAAIDLDIKQLLLQFAIQAKLVVPILSQNELKGLLVAHQCSKPRLWQDSEIELLKQLADQIGVALSQAQLLNNLEEMVAERTGELRVTNQRLQLEITERQQTETALRENQQMLAGILEYADEAIISIDEQYKILLFNQGAEKIFGYQASEIMGQSLDTLLPEKFRHIHRQHIDQFSDSMEQARSMAQRSSSNVYGLRNNGEEFPAEASISKLHTHEGLIFTVMLQDITERQRTEEKLQASQRLLAKAEKIARIGSWEYNLFSKKLTWSEELYNILGFTFSKTIPDCAAIFDSIHPDDHTLVRNTLHLGHKEGKPWQFNFRWSMPNGSIKYLETRGEATINSSGEIVKVSGTIMDISDRVQAEISLRRSEDRLQLITNSLPVLIAYIDNQHRYRYNNRTYEIWFGKSRTDLIGLHVRELLGEDNYQQMLPYIKTALSGRAVTFENQHQNERGGNYWISAIYVPDFDSEGKVQGFFSMIDDITERKAIQQMQSEFVSVASHEMRTPLTSIHGVLKLLCADRLGDLSTSGKEMSNIALRNTDRLIRLINDVLDLERMESGREKLEKQLCNSADLIQYAIETMHSLAQQQQVKIETDTNSVELWVDSDRILQTLTNLLSNAIKFSPPNSTVWIACEQQKHQVLFTVKDRGRGIPLEKQETIFNRFQQVDASDSRKKGGTGLGLSICRHIVEQHGGKIWVESVINKGSTFFFILPQ